VPAVLACIHGGTRQSARSNVAPDGGPCAGTFLAPAARFRALGGGPPVAGGRVVFLGI
jgi:hypothetical protein